jgi:parallel beta-helix repeat protein
MLWHGFYSSGTAFSHIYNNTFSNSYAAVGGACLIKSAYNYVYNNTFNGQSTDWAFSAYQEPGGGSAWWLSPNGTMFYRNKLTSYSTGGVFLSCGSTYSAGNITIANNTFVNCGTGIQTVSGSSTVLIENMTFIGNSFTTGIYGIRLGYFSAPDSYTNSIDILNNTITSETTGIAVYSGSTNPTVQYNTFSSCTSPVIDTNTDTAFRFNVGLNGYYMLNVTVVGSGSTFPSGLGWQYSSGSTASVTWSPSTGYARQNISIDGTNQSTTVSPLNVTMSANHVVIAYFVVVP